MTEFEAERERLATLMDLQIELHKLEVKGKTELSIAELQALLCEYGEKIKVHQ